MNQIAHSTSDSASLRANRAQTKHGARALGMTLIEVLIGLAITTLMTVAGWRAIDALQSAREQTYRDANQWQTLDTLFTTIESDMRRADFSRFSGGTDSFTLRLNPLGASDIADTVRYVAQVAGENRIQIVRQATSGGVVMAEVDALRFSYRKLPRANEPASGSESSISEYPRAIEIALIIPGGDPESRRSITRTLVLR
jgi:hypothetical protein